MLLLTAVHAQPLATLTLNVLAKFAAWEPILIDEGLMLTEQDADAPLSVIVTVCPATDSVPVKVALEVFGATVKVMVTLVPGPRIVGTVLVIVIKLLVLGAEIGQALEPLPPTESRTLPVPPAAEKLEGLG